MRRTRILLVEMPRMLCDIITETVSTEPDLEIIGEFADDADLVATAMTTRADVVILGLPDTDLPPVCDELVWARPQLRVLAVAGDGRQVLLHELRPQTLTLGEVSPQELVEVIRGGAPPDVQ